MEIHHSDDLGRKYSYMLFNACISYFISIITSILYIDCTINGYYAAGFMINSAGIVLVSKFILHMYEYFIAAFKYTENVRYSGGVHRYISIFLLAINGVFYIISLINYRMSFDSSINNTEEELFITIAFCMWTFVIYSTLDKVNSRVEEYIKMIKG